MNMLRRDAQIGRLYWFNFIWLTIKYKIQPFLLSESI